MSPRWWAAFGPAEALLRCGDAEHRLRWADGKLQAMDHPEADGELVLAALGSDTSPCLDLVMAWGRRSDDLTLLAVGPRSAADTLSLSAAVVNHAEALGMPGPASVSIGGTSAMIYAHRPGRARRIASYAGSLGSRGLWRFLGSRALARPARRPRLIGRSSGWSGSSAFGWAGTTARALLRARMLSGADGDLQARCELIRLLALGVPFQFRLSAAVAHAWSADGERAGRAEQARPALTAGLAGRLAPAAAQWLDIDPAEVDAIIHEGAGWGELALSKTGGNSRLTARLPVGWLASVWAPGLAVVDHHFVVTVLDVAWPDAQVLAVRSPARDPAEMSIRYDNGNWSVTSR